jgi:hypothetical protein
LRRRLCAVCDDAGQVDPHAAPGAAFDICLFSDTPLDVPEHLRALDVRAKVFAAPNPFQGGSHQGRHGTAAYLRLMIPAQVAGRHDRILDLDSGILCAGTGLNRLMVADTGRAKLGAVRGNLQWRTFARPCPDYSTLGRPERPYLGIGVVLIDVGGWQAAGDVSQAWAMFADHGAAAGAAR